jgi:alkylated DNA repair protein (DNA oxidative demethylase)
MPSDPATPDLFKEPNQIVPLAKGAVVLGDFARSVEAPLLSTIDQVAAAAPFRQMITPGGFRMSVAMTNCGAVGWITDRRGYRYDRMDPETGLEWPRMPAVFTDIAARAAEAAGFSNFSPDACLINRYRPGTRLSLHQDRNERDFAAPIVSISLGLPAVFLFGGLTRADRPRRVALAHCDVVVWGGPARLAFHGIMPLADGEHAVLGRQRLNLTLRQAL